MAETKIKAGQFSGIVGHGTDGYFLMTNGDGTMAWAEGGATGPSVTSVSYPGDDLAADPAGGQTIVLTGANFAASGMTVSIGGTTAPSVAHDSNTQLTITTPVKAAGDYDIVVTNTVTGASGTFVNGISYNGIPSWTTATGSLGTFESETTISTVTLQATEPDGGTITFNITNGALPTGLSLTGANIDGTTTAESSTTLYSFTIEAIDDENQSTPRNFSITVNAAALISSENFTINTYTGNGSTQSIEGKIGTAASFDGSSSYVSGLPTVKNTTEEFSISLWFNTTVNPPVQHTMLGAIKEQGTNDSVVAFKMTSDGYSKLYLRGTDGTLHILADTVDATDGNWHHLVGTVNGSNAVLYVDGLQVDTATISNNITVDNLLIGAENNRATLNPTNYFNGKIDQVRIFNKALSSEEVTTLYGENNTSTTKSTTDIFDDGSGVALYEFEEGAKDTGGTNGYIGAGGVFNGSNSKIDIGSLVYPVSLKGTINELSISLWFKSNASPTASEEFVTWWSGGAGDVYLDGFLGLTSSNTIRFGDGWNSAYTFPNTNYVGNWTHIVAVKSSNNAYLYINGSLVATKGSSLSWGFNRNLIIGGDQGGAEYFNGSLDQIRLFNKAISSSEVTTLYGETSASATKSTTDIFDDGSGVALYELEGNANDSGRFGSGAIDSGQSAVFTGSSASTGSRISFSNNVYGSSTTVFSASLWVKCTNTAGEIPLIGNGSTIGGTTGYVVYINSGSLVLSFANGSNYDFFYGQSINDNNWHHIAITYNNGDYVLYLNGSVELSGTSSIFLNNASPTYDTFLGNRWARTQDTTNAVLNGSIDQVRIYSSALSASDVKALISEINVPTTNLTAHYKLDGNSNDETGNYNGTASNITYSDPAEFPTYDGTATNVSYAYDGTPTNVSFVGTSFQPDFVWIKTRETASWNTSHYTFNSVSGAFRRLKTNSADSENTFANSLSSFDSNGFTVQTALNINDNNQDYVAWNWKAGGAAVSNTDGTITSQVSANTEAGFSIVKYTANATSGATIGHGLDQELDLLIVKSTNLGQAWNVYVKDVTDTSSKYLRLNENFSIADLITANSRFIPNNFTDSVFSVGNDNSTNGISGTDTYIAYCFHSVDSYQKVGSYSGGQTLNTDNIVDFGFTPRFVIVKNITVATGWLMIDSIRPNGYALFANDSGAEGNYSGHIKLSSSGLRFDGNNNNVNASGNNYIYLAIA